MSERRRKRNRVLTNEQSKGSVLQKASGVEARGGRGGKGYCLTGLGRNDLGFSSLHRDAGLYHNKKIV